MDAIPTAPRAGEVLAFRFNDPQGPVEMKFCWIPPGTFQMGGNEVGDNPQHTVTISKGFWMGRTEVTQAQWMAVTGNTPSFEFGGDRPTDSVSWNDCQQFCTQMNNLHKRKMNVKLPTEAEWEYACRAGTTTEYWSGDGEAALQKLGWFRGNSLGRTHFVGTLAANPWGLSDVHGNVMEWCEDVYGSLSSGTQTDPIGQSSGDDRVLRGGGRYSTARECFAAYRSRSSPGARGVFWYGCRVCFRTD